MLRESFEFQLGCGVDWAQIGRLLIAKSKQGTECAARLNATGEPAGRDMRGTCAGGLQTSKVVLEVCKSLELTGLCLSTECSVRLDDVRCGGWPGRLCSNQDLD